MVESYVVETENDRDTVYTAEERTLRITQLANHIDFDYEAIDTWWTAEKKHSQVAVKMRN